MILYFIPQSSFYVELEKIRYSGADYVKADLRYYSKISLTLIAHEKNVKLYRDVIRGWYVTTLEQAQQKPLFDITEDIDYERFFKPNSRAGEDPGAALLDQGKLQAEGGDRLTQ